MADRHSAIVIARIWHIGRFIALVKIGKQYHVAVFWWPITYWWRVK